MLVKLLRWTPNPEEAIALSARLCYSAVGVDGLRKKMGRTEVEKFINRLKSMGHLSAFEHVNFTFAVEGISRACSHQLVRHRIASYSQQSQRYVKKEEFDYITPPEIEFKTSAKRIFKNSMKYLQSVYQKLLQDGIPAEDARYVLPNACETKIIISMNARELLHFFSLRLCDRAQWEIRELADLMLKEVKQIAPMIFKNAGPGCITGSCPEKEFSCGKAKEYRKKYKEK